MVAASAGFASGQQAFVSFPTEIRRALVSAEDACRRARRCARHALSQCRTEGRSDRRRSDDYIVDFHETECVGRAAFFCGTGGCDLLILVALREARYARYSTTVCASIEILSGRGASDIRFVLRGSYCGGHGNPSCEKTHRITSEPFKFTQPDR